MLSETQLKQVIFLNAARLGGEEQLWNIENNGKNLEGVS